MTVPTLYNFTEALQAPDLAFSTLRDCHPRRTATGGVALSRTSRFAEAEIEWQSRKYLLCFPLSTASIFAVEQTAARLRYLRTPLLTEYTILRDEMTYTDDTGTTRTCDVVLHRLPEGRPLSVCAAEFDAESLRSALDKLEAGLSELGFSHNNLKPGNLYVTSDGRLIPVRYHFARFGEGHDAEGFERLRQFVREQGGNLFNFRLFLLFQNWSRSRLRSRFRFLFLYHHRLRRFLLGLGSFLPLNHLFHHGFCFRSLFNNFRNWFYNLWRSFLVQIVQIYFTHLLQFGACLFRNNSFHHLFFLFLRFKTFDRDRSFVAVLVLSFLTKFFRLYF